MITGSQLSKTSLDNRCYTNIINALILYHKLTTCKDKVLNCDATRRTKVGMAESFDTYLALNILLILRTSIFNRFILKEELTW